MKLTREREEKLFGIPNDKFELPLPNQWVAIASWKSEEYLNEMRATPWFKDHQLRMLACCTAPMVMEIFTGMAEDRRAFEIQPAGSSTVHMKTGALDVVFL